MSPSFSSCCCSFFLSGGTEAEIVEVLSDVIFDGITGVPTSAGRSRPKNHYSRECILEIIEGKSSREQHAIVDFTPGASKRKGAHVLNAYHLDLDIMTVGGVESEIDTLMTMLPKLSNESNGEPCLLVTPYMRGSTLCVTPSLSGIPLSVCHVKPPLVHKNDDLSLELNRKAKLGRKHPLITWGPVVPPAPYNDNPQHRLWPNEPNRPQYRRPYAGKNQLEKAEYGGFPQSDRSTIVGVYRPDEGWRIYAQVVRRRPRSERSLARPGEYVVVEVWKLWPQLYPQDREPKKMWPKA